MLHLHLTDTQRIELQALCRTNLPAVSRSRLEMILLFNVGWSAPRIATHLGCHSHTTRAALKGFPACGTTAFTPELPGPEPDHVRREQVTGQLAELPGQDRTWTSRQLAEALRPDGVTIGHRQVRRYLGLMKAGYRRTARTVSHKQAPHTRTQCGCRI